MESLPVLSLETGQSTSPVEFADWKDSSPEHVMDDGKVNVMSTAMLKGLDAAFDRAEQDRAIVILTSGRPGLFTAGFDTKILARADPDETFEMVRLGADLAARVLAYRYPVVAACPGHCFPMGAFLLLASDVRIGAGGPYKIGLNEVAIGIPVPSFGLELGRQRLSPAHLQRTALTGEMFAPQEAATAGFLDRVVAAEDLQATARAAAEALTQIHLPSHATIKARLRAAAVQAVRAAINTEITLEAYRKKGRPRHATAIAQPLARSTTAPHRCKDRRRGGTARAECRSSNRACAGCDRAIAAQAGGHATRRAFEHSRPLRRAFRPRRRREPGEVRPGYRWRSHRVTVSRGGVGHGQSRGVLGRRPRLV